MTHDHPRHIFLELVKGDGVAPVLDLGINEKGPLQWLETMDAQPTKQRNEPYQYVYTCVDISLYIERERESDYIHDYKL